MSFEWEKIASKPDKSHKIQGHLLLNLKETLETQEQTNSELSAKVKSLEKEVSNLKSEVAKGSEEIASLSKEVDEFTDYVSEKDSENENLKRDLADKTNEINTLRSQLEEAQNTLTEKNKEIEELKEKIPKKPVYEKADEVVKGAGCPKCGWTTMEEYKYVDGRKQLIRKYCPNTFCLWTSSEEPKIKISVTQESPDEESKEIRIFKMNGTEIEEVETLSSNMVAIIADPAQEIVWIWKGTDSSRFEYSEATRQAVTIKNDIVKKAYAPINRVNENEEPENFPAVMKT